MGRLMFTFAWLLWWLLHVRGLLEKKTREVVFYRLRRPGRVRVREVAEDLYPAVRAAAYLGWLGQVAHLRFEARRRGGEIGFVPSMPGVSPLDVEDAVREILRVADGHVAGNAQSKADELTSRLMGIVHNVARETVARASVPDLGEAKRSVGYAAEYGNPVARLMAEVRDPSREMGKFFRAEREWRADVDAMTEHWKREFADPPDGNDEDSSSQEDEEAELQRELEEERRRYEKEAEEEAEREVRRWEDELRFGKGVVKGRFPVGWARIPTGAYTCPFCLLLCARGPVYRKNTVLDAKREGPYTRNSRAKGKFLGRYSASAYHYKCDCKAVPVYYEKDYEGRDIVEGADAVYRRYRKGGGPADIREFAKWLKTDEGRAAARDLLPGPNVEDWIERWKRY